MNTNTQITKSEPQERAIEYVPFGAADKIRLTVVMVQDFVAVKTRSGHTCDKRDAMRFIMLCQAQRLNPFAGDAFLVGYDTKDGAKFSLITSHVAFMKRAESCQDFEGMESGVILADENNLVTEREGDFYMPSETVVGGWAKVYRRGRKPTYRRLAVEQRKPAYQTPFWDAPKHAEQIVKCAEADALRATFPSLLGGLHTEPELMVQVSAIATEAPRQKQVKMVSSRQLTEPPRDGDDVPMDYPEPKSVEVPITLAAAKDAPAATQESQEPDYYAGMEDYLTGAGISFDVFRKWLGMTKRVNDADSLGGLPDVPQKVLKDLAADAKSLAALTKFAKGQQ